MTKDTNNLDGILNVHKKNRDKTGKCIIFYFLMIFLSLHASKFLYDKSETVVDVSLLIIHL